MNVSDDADRDCGMRRTLSARARWGRDAACMSGIAGVLGLVADCYFLYWHSPWSPESGVYHGMLMFGLGIMSAVGISAAAVLLRPIPLHSKVCLFVAMLLLLRVIWIYIVATSI